MNKANSRYSRQLVLQEIGKGGQQKLTESSIAIVGIGALGSMAAELLARAGIGEVILIDRDIVEESNLQRQTLFLNKDQGRSKALAAKQRILEINPALKIQAFPIHLNAKNKENLKKAQVIIDCTDNIQTRLFLNDYCKKENIPLVYGTAIKTSGYAMVILPNGPCLSCFLKETALETCETVGVLNTITASIAALQATLTMKLIIGEKIPPILYRIDIWQGLWKQLNVKKNPKCKPCQGIYEYLHKEDQIKLIKFCSVNLYEVKGRKLELPNIKKQWEKIDMVIDDELTLKFKNIFLFADGRALINASSEKEALATYSKWIGN